MSVIENERGYNVVVMRLRIVEPYEGCDVGEDQPRLKMSVV